MNAQIFLNGEPIKVENLKIIIESKEDQEKAAGLEFLNQTMEEEFVLSLYRPAVDSDYNSGKVLNLTTPQIAERIKVEYANLNINNSVVANIGRALAKNGFKRKRIKNGDSIRNCWQVVKVER